MGVIVSAERSKSNLNMNSWMLGFITRKILNCVDDSTGVIEVLVPRNLQESNQQNPLGLLVDCLGLLKTANGNNSKLQRNYVHCTR